MTQTILASASAQTLRTVLPYVAELVSEHQWGRLVERHPTLMEELLLAQVGVRPRDAARWANAGVLERPSCLAPCVDLLLRCGKPLGPAFFRKFLHAYAKHTVDNPTTQTGLDVLGVTAERVMSLDMYMRYYLLSYPDRKVRVREALSVLSVYKTIQSVEGGSGWTWKYIRRLLLVLVEEFSRRPDLWDAALQQPISATDDILSALIGLFKELGPGVIQMQTLSNTVQLATQPRGARFPLVALAYSALGLTLTVVPSGAAVSQYPPCPMGVLASLDPDHCRMFLQTGLEVMGNSFFHYSASKMSHQSALIVSDTLELLDELPAEQQNEARMAILRAACVGARRGPAGDMASGTEGLTDVRNDIDGYVKLAARSPDASLRLLHIQMALNLCMLAQSPQRFHETLQPALQKYAKDPVVGPGIFNYVASTPHVLRFLAGPPGLYVKRSVAARVTREVLGRWMEQSSLILTALLDLVKSWMFNPEGNAPSSHTQLTTTFSTVFQNRLDLLRLITPVLIDSVPEAIALLLDPLLKVLVSWETLKVLEQPDVFGFDWETCVPLTFSSVNLCTSLFPAVLAYMCEFGRIRADLYRKGRSKLPMPAAEDDDTPSWRYQTGEYSFLPFDVRLSTPPSTFYCGIDAPELLKNYCEDVLFLPLELGKAFKHAIRSTDKWHFHTTQFENALSAYLYYSVDPSELVNKVEKLLKHYSDADYTFLILRNETVRNFIWSDARLRKHMVRWLPAQIWETNGRPPVLSLLDEKMQELAPPFLATPLVWFPKKPFAKRAGRPTLLEARNTPCDDDEIVKVIFPDYRGRLDITKSMSRRLSALAISWLMSTCRVPRKEIPESERDPIRLAIHSAAIEFTFRSFIDSAHPELILGKTLDSLSDSEFDAIIKTLFSLPESPLAQKYAFHCVRLARSSRPYLLEERTFDILGQSSLSNWHRHVVCTSALTHLSHDPAVRRVQRLIQFIVDLAEQDRERKKVAASTAKDQGVKAEEAEPLVKITTVKMLIEVIGQAIAIGILSPEHITFLQILEKAVSHASVKLQVVCALGDLILEEHILAPGAASPAFSAMASYVAVGSRLSEGRGVSDAEWENLARNAGTPMPEVDAEHPIASRLLRAPVDRFPKVLSDTYARAIIEPCILGQIQARTKWLQTAAAREGARTDIHATYDEEFNAAALYTHFRRFLPHREMAPLDHDASSIMDLVQRRATLFLNRAPYAELIARLKANHPDDWQTSAYGKTAALLCSAATYNESSVFTVAVDALVQALLGQDLSAATLQDVCTALTRIGQSILHPDNIAACFSPPPTRSGMPFEAVEKFLNLVSKARLGPTVEWSSTLQPILEHLLAAAERHIGHAEGPVRNPAALYEAQIFRLKLLLLPHPGYQPFVGSADRYKNWVDAITRVLEEIFASPAPYRHFPRVFVTFIRKSPRIASSDAIQLVTLLCADAGHSVATRAARIELAQILAVEYNSDIQSDAPAREQLEDIRQELLAAQDGIIRVLGFKM
ncbi:hypothetical protein EXIGLDRAFT_771016 [Exidia glandulosa HHB12029]|uniref:Uncharacterized protein n=1 Tax=Exidia glandulosa HHB12029 TaxID=1314781 RepID=A0A165GBC6_EXIGL|nr:hypothetical protein EXIGLDRAFT_771016 [Exidia glandulosa HHB12029]